MPGKRKRLESIQASLPTTNLSTAHDKPLSAIAAARLKVETSSINAGAVPDSASLPEGPVPLEDADEEPAPIVPAKILKLCNWRHDVHNVLADTESELTIKLSKHSTIAALGCYQLRVLKGAININGANIGSTSRNGHRDQSYAVVAPASHPILKIRGLDDVNRVQLRSTANSAPMADISLSFADLWVAEKGSKNQRSFSIVTDSTSDRFERPLTPEITPEEWLRAIEACASVTETSVMVGPPTSGKSTFAKRLVNRLLTGQGKSAQPVPAVCYLGLDPQNTEYTPQGELSLVKVECLNLGPNFTYVPMPPSNNRLNQDEIVRSHPIPAYHVDYMAHYQACAEDLYLTYQNLQALNPSLPLVVDIPGTLYASDFHLILSLLSRIKPHNIVHMDSTRVIGLDTGIKLHSLQTTSLTFRGTVHEIAADLPTSNPLRSARELMGMKMQSYFHLKSTKEFTMPTWTLKPISTWVPWEFSYQKKGNRYQDFIGFAMYTQVVEQASLVHGLLGTVIKIVELIPFYVPKPDMHIRRTDKYGLPYFAKTLRCAAIEPFAPRSTRLICTAMIRGIDPIKKVVQVLVPRSQEKLLREIDPERVIFVAGCCDVPEWAYLEEARQAREYAGTLPDAVPWLEEGSRIDEMGYLNIARRVRKFQT